MYTNSTSTTTTFSFQAIKNLRDYKGENHRHQLVNSMREKSRGRVWVKKRVREVEQSCKRDGGD